VITNVVDDRSPDDAGEDAARFAVKIVSESDEERPAACCAENRIETGVTAGTVCGIATPTIRMP
jgi:hypothetical protein